jgi:hypothetical protein
MAEQKSSSALTAPLRNAASAMRKVPGADLVTKAAEGTLDKIGAVSPRGRRMAVYAGAGVLGVTGLVEWPVAVTGAAVAWLTQPRPDTETAHPETAGSVTEGMTDSVGHGVYVATGDAATAPPAAAGTAAPGPVREDEMPGGPAASSAAPTPPSTDPLAPPATPTTPPTDEATPPTAPPTDEATPPTAPTAPPTS